ncbi:MAG: hypothetical protein LBG92_12660 [Prevotellaceae bacterium]|jgi:hypothetical protein|nr:hypothetical protein [Prevotellaceae bacterium]
MDKKEIFILILIAVLWILLRIVEYYLLPYYLCPLSWLGVSFAFLIIAIVQLIKLIAKIKHIQKIRIIKVVFYGLIFYLSLNRWIVAHIIEKADWRIFYQKRVEIVEKVQKKELNHNAGRNNRVCELPFEFPIISNGGNDIIISQNDSTQTITVEFFIFRNFMSSPSSYFIYTNDKYRIEYYENYIKNNPDNNWKIEDNWYRITKE